MSCPKCACGAVRTWALKDKTWVPLPDGWTPAFPHVDGSVRPVCPECSKVQEAERILAAEEDKSLDLLAHLQFNLVRFPGETDDQLRQRLVDVLHNTVPGMGRQAMTNLLCQHCGRPYEEEAPRYRPMNSYGYSQRVFACQDCYEAEEAEEILRKDRPFDDREWQADFKRVFPVA